MWFISNLSELSLNLINSSCSVQQCLSVMDVVIYIYRLRPMALGGKASKHIRIQRLLFFRSFEIHQVDF